MKKKLSLKEKLLEEFEWRFLFFAKCVGNDCGLDKCAYFRLNGVLDFMEKCEVINQKEFKFLSNALEAVYLS
ncbi:MAG: hypothetical protein HFI29_05915 [Lachnospiraceae bacterium]|jgi:hypothetical protein|nr:hypothetical protein [Lachnospiraceae bacterium]